MAEKAFSLNSLKRRPKSQEEELQSCNLARESADEVLSGMQSSSSSAEQATGILMVTMPEESSDDDYETPPDHMMLISSQHSSINDDDTQPLATNTTALICLEETESVGVGVGETMVVDDTFERKPKRRIVDITNDSSDNLIRVSTPTLEYNDTTTDNNNSDTLMVVDLNETQQIEDDEETLEMLKNDRAAAADIAPKVFVEMPMRKHDEGLNKKRDNHHHDLDSKGKRRLPSSVVYSTTESTQKKHDEFVGMLDRALKLLKGKGGQVKLEPRDDDDGDDDDDDFLATAKRRGMTFPRPRWWPP